VYIGCMKLTMILVFAWNCGVEAPRWYLAPKEPNWKAAAGLSLSQFHCKPWTSAESSEAVATGALPMLIVIYTTAPFVAYVHVRVPSFARRSKEALLRWASRIPGDTELDLTTMRAYGKLRVSRLLIKDLRHTSSWTSLANLSRVLPASLDVSTKRQWWMLKPMRRFYVGSERRTVREISVWQEVLKKIPKESQNSLPRGSNSLLEPSSTLSRHPPSGVLKPRSPQRNG